MGPAARHAGTRRYIGRSTVLQTHWTLENDTLVLIDARLMTQSHSFFIQEAVTLHLRAVGHHAAEVDADAKMPLACWWHRGIALGYRQLEAHGYAAG